MSYWYVGAAIVAGALVASSQKAPEPPPPQAPTPPPQPSQAPDANAALSQARGMGQGGGAPGVAQTFLTGPGGVDQSTLQLGKTTLLGG